MKVKALLLIGAALLAASGAAHAQKRGGELKFGVSAEPPNYDCHANSSFAFVHPVRLRDHGPIEELLVLADAGEDAVLDEPEGGSPEPDAQG